MANSIHVAPGVIVEVVRSRGDVEVATAVQLLT